MVNFLNSIVPHATEFMAQNIPFARYYCSLRMEDIDHYRKSNIFPAGAEIRGCDFYFRPDFISPIWVAFPEYPFLLGLKFPFTGIIEEFFSKTGIPYIQTMPGVWRILHWINLLNENKGMNVGLEEIASVYDIKSLRSLWFVLKRKPGRTPLVEDFSQEDGLWKERFFFVKRSTIPLGETLPMEWIQEAPKFGDIAPASSDTMLKVQQFLELPLLDRTFSLQPVSFSNDSSSDNSADGEFVPLPPSDPPMIPGDSSRSKSTKEKNKCVKDDSSRSKSKRKRNSDHRCMKVDKPIGLAQRLKGTIEESSAQIVEIMKEEQSKIRNLEDKLAEQDRSFQEREDILRRSFEALISQMETEMETRDEVFLKFLSGREEMREKHDTEMEMTRMESDADIALAVLRAKLEVATVDPARWDVEGWKDSIFQLTGIHLDWNAEGGEFAGQGSSKDDGATSKGV